MFPTGFSFPFSMLFALISFPLSLIGFMLGYHHFLLTSVETLANPYALKPVLMLSIW